MVMTMGGEEAHLPQDHVRQWMHCDRRAQLVRTKGVQRLDDLGVDATVASKDETERIQDETSDAMNSESWRRQGRMKAVFLHLPQTVAALCRRKCFFRLLTRDLPATSPTASPPKGRHRRPRTRLRRSRPTRLALCDLASLVPDPQRRCQSLGAAEFSLDWVTGVPLQVRWAELGQRHGACRGNGALGQPAAGDSLVQLIELCWGS